MKTNSKIKVIGLDLDGTLYEDSIEIHEKIRGKIYEKISILINVPIADAADLFKEKYERIGSGTRVINEIAKEKGISDLNSSDFMQDAFQEANFLNLISPDKEVGNLIHRLSDKYDKRVDLITGSEYKLALGKLDRLGIKSECFGLIFSSNDGSKTSGEMYEKWMGIRKEFGPENFLYIGDNIKQDIKSPKRFGIKTCHIGDSPDADYNIKNILELEKILG